MNQDRPDQPEHSPRDYEWLRDVYERDIKPAGSGALERARKALAERDVKAILCDLFGEQYEVPRRMWRKEPVANRTYPVLKTGWTRFNQKFDKTVLGPYVRGWVFVPKSKLGEVVQATPESQQAAEIKPAADDKITNVNHLKWLATAIRIAKEKDCPNYKGKPNTSEIARRIKKGAKLSVEAETIRRLLNRHKERWVK